MSKTKILLGGVVFPAVVSVKQIEISFIRSKRYYSLGSIAAATCWVVVIILYR